MFRMCALVRPTILVIETIPQIRDCMPDTRGGVEVFTSIVRGPTGPKMCQMICLHCVLIFDTAVHVSSMKN